MIKQQEYDWKDSNLALFGSDQEKKVKLESAQSEPAWKGSGDNLFLSLSSSSGSLTVLRQHTRRHTLTLTLTVFQSCKGYTSARDYHVTVGK